MYPMTADPRAALVLAHQHQAELRATYPRRPRHDTTRGLLARLRASRRRQARTLPVGVPTLQGR
jgi:hypothetical protein